MSIFEMSGREVLNYHYSGMNLEKSLDISSLGSGVYFVGIQSDKDRVVRKITIL
ncbi:MAG: T9SS type A sorting domain-containing protein [Saprospiraceae bacterium]